MVGCLVAGTLRRRLAISPWPLLVAPFVLSLAIGYMSDSFYPPFWTELLSRLPAGAVQGLSAWAGWFCLSRIQRFALKVTAGSEGHVSDRG
jgi:hypothetical protein